MTNLVRRSATVIVIAVLLSFVSLLNTTQMRAQVCPNITVVNGTACTVNLCLVDAAGFVRCQLIPGGGGPIVIPPFNPVGVQSNAGIFYPFNPPPPAVGFTPCITLPGPVVPPCCGVVSWDPNFCRITINPCPGPCLP
ncbi:MAG: hypothetical protein JST22_00600 [Bacteroidetes bacterium]|nr:hypothetical protein [Bacteroidota bacterium]